MEQEIRCERQAAGIAIAKQAGNYTGRKVGSVKAQPARSRRLVQQGVPINCRDKHCHTVRRAVPVIRANSTPSRAATSTSNRTRLSSFTLTEARNDGRRKRPKTRPFLKIARSAVVRPWSVSTKSPPEAYRKIARSAMVPLWWPSTESPPEAFMVPCPPLMVSRRCEPVSLASSSLKCDSICCDFLSLRTLFGNLGRSERPSFPI